MKAPLPAGAFAQRSDVRLFIMRVPSARGVAAAAAVVLATLVAPTFGTEAVHRINCGGGDFVDADGLQWVADYGYVGNGIAKDMQTDPTPAVLAHPQANVFLSERFVPEISHSSL